MKVLEENKSFWKMKVRCTGKGNEKENARNGVKPCGSILEVTAKDIYRTDLWYSPAYGEEPSIIGHAYTIMCPCCGSETDIPKALLPKQVKEIANYNHKPDSESDLGMEL